MSWDIEDLRDYDEEREQEEFIKKEIRERYFLGSEIEDYWYALFDDAFDGLPAEERFTKEQGDRWLTFARDVVNEFDPTTPKAVTRDMAIVLLALRSSQTTLSQASIEQATSKVDLEQETRISRRTIQKILQKLEARIWVIRPDGERSGYMITPEGERIVAKLEDRA